MKRFSFQSRYLRRSKAAMSLLELLAVIGLVSGMLSLCVAAMNGMFRSTSRVAAVDCVMSLMDQGRAKAIASGRPVYVVFADASFPVEQQWRAVALYTEGSDLTAPLSPLTPWVALPGQVRFRPRAGSLLHRPAAVDELQITTPGAGELKALPYLKFNALGGVDYPLEAASARLFMAWGHSETDAQAAAEGTPAPATSDVIVISTFTGKCTFQDEPSIASVDEQPELDSETSATSGSSHSGLTYQ